MLDSSGAGSATPAMVNNGFSSPNWISKLFPIGFASPKYFFAIFGVTITEFVVGKGSPGFPCVNLKSKILNNVGSTIVTLSLKELLLTFISVLVLNTRHIDSTSGKLLCMAGPIGMEVIVF